MGTSREFAVGKLADYRSYRRMLRYRYDKLLSMLLRGLDELSMQVGLVVLAAMMEEEVTALVGPKGEHLPKQERTCYRHSYEPGWVTMAGRKVHVERSRVRSKSAKGEMQLDTYIWAQQEDSISEAVLARILNGSLRGGVCRNPGWRVSGTVRYF